MVHFGLKLLGKFFSGGAPDHPSNVKKINLKYVCGLWSNRRDSTVSNILVLMTH